MVRPAVGLWIQVEVTPDGVPAFAFRPIGVTTPTPAGVSSNFAPRSLASKLRRLFAVGINQFKCSASDHLGPIIHHQVG